MILCFLLLWIAREGIFRKIIQVSVQQSFFLVPPTPINDGISLDFLFQHIVHLVLELKFPSMFPMQQSINLTLGKSQTHQPLFAHTRHHSLFYFLPDPQFFILQPGVGTQNRQAQTSQKEYARQFFQARILVQSNKPVQIGQWCKANINDSL